MKAFVAIVGAVANLLLAVPGMTHHSFAAVFDINQPVEFTGSVAELEWTNPHAWIHIDVEDTDGNVERWSVELLGINTLLKQGWSPSILGLGDAISVEGFRARDGSNSANATMVTVTETGEQLWVAASRDSVEE